MDGRGTGSREAVLVNTAIFAPHGAAALRVKEVRVSNFRVFGEARLELGDMTALIGSNGAGKTALLLAIGRFFGRQATMNAANFASRDAPITVTVVAEGEAGEAVEVTRRWRLDKKRGGAASPGYVCGNRAAVSLGEFLDARAVYVPAGLETAGGGKAWSDTALQSLINNVTGHRGAGRAERGDGFRGGRRVDIGRMEDTLNEKLGALDGVGYAPNMGVRLEFGDPAEQAGIRMTITDRETGQELDHAHVGHGARRALHMAALETDADMLGRAGAEAAGDMATLYIIDEPELHLHPQRQDIVFDALRRLSGKPSSQVVYATHSPRFVSLGTQMRIHRVRRARGGIDIRSTAGIDGSLLRGGTASPITEAIFANGALLVEGHHDREILGAILRAVPHGGMPLMAALASREVAVVDCRSKYNIGPYRRILGSLGICCFVVWDGDMDMDGLALGQAKDYNARLLGAMGEEASRAEEITRAGGDGCIVGGNWACFGHNLPAYLARYFQLTPKRLERKITEGEDIGQLLDMNMLSRDESFATALGRIRRVLVG